jgi:UDP-N-acetylglucosamine transferase subunit ALG13
VPRAEFERLAAGASLVISHGGTTVLEVVRLGKVPVVMPRRRKYGEHVNDHQLEFVELLAAEGRVAPAWEPEDLPHAVVEARGRVAYPIERSKIRRLVELAIEELASKRVQGR